jgi:hypothetical protein
MVPVVEYTMGRTRDGALVCSCQEGVRQNATCSVTDMWVPLIVLNGPCFVSAHIPLTKQKIGVDFILAYKHRVEPFHSQNLEWSHSVLLDS